MKFVTLFISINLFCHLFAQQETRPSSTQKSVLRSDKEIIIKTEHERLKALVDGNIPLAKQLHAEDFQLITPKGNPLSKEQYLGMISSGRLKYNWEAGDITVKIYGNAAVLRYKDKIFQVTLDNKPVNNGRFTHTNLYEKRNGKWQIVWSQASGENIPFPTTTEIAFSKKEYTLPFTQEFDFNSVVNGQNYRVFVALPPNYSNKDTIHYKTLYVLDGNDHWPLVVQSHRLIQAGFMGNRSPDWPEYIIVGIGYPAETYWNTMPFRAPDYTPTQNVMEDSVLIKPFGVNRRTGGATEFLQVIKNEIIPFIDRTFLTNDDRGIIGHSLGAGFVAFALFKEPTLFNKYALLSPNFWRDNNFLISEESEFAKKNKQLPKRIFIARGAVETNAITNSTPQMIDSLRSHGYVGLDLQTYIFPEEKHFSVIPAAISRSLQVLGYDPPGVKRNP